MDEIEELQNRLVKLAKEKSRYQLLSDIMKDLIKKRGLEEVVHHAVNTIMDAWGGSNVILYYQQEDLFYRNDIYEENLVIDSIDDSLVNQVMESGNFLEVSQEEETPVNENLSHLSGNQKTWLYPLKTENETFGVIKIEGIYLNYIGDVRDLLEIIIQYFAIILRNELLNTGKLMRANKALKHEIAERIDEQIRYKKTIESSFDGFWIVDSHGNFLDVNETYCDMTGYSREELLHMTISQVEALESHSDTKHHMEALIKIGKGHFESKHKCRDGSIIDVEVNTIFSQMSDGYFYVFLRDISERIKAEKEKILLQEQHFQAQRVESIGRLAGGIAHDLNNLLTPILGYSEILSEEFKISDSRKDHVHEIYKAGIRARDLVNQLLIFSKKQNLEFRIVRLNEIIEGFQKLLRRTIRENITFHMDLSPGLECIKADTGQIEQVLMNLAVNAQDAMPQGGSLSFITDSFILNSDNRPPYFEIEEGEYIRLKVADNGSGISDEIRKKIFEPFYSTKGDLGTGLGLATVYGIVKQHNGEIDMESVLGSGTVFTIYLPVCHEDQSEETVLSTEDLDHAHQGTILLVEDNNQVRELTSRILKKKGYQVLMAENGFRGLEILKTGCNKIDLLITDMVMPELNGRELYERVLEIQPGIPFLFISGYHEEAILFSRERNSEDHFLKKPYTANSLLTKVFEIMHTK